MNYVQEKINQLNPEDKDKLITLLKRIMDEGDLLSIQNSLLFLMRIPSGWI
jgi:hypothetical protein